MDELNENSTEQATESQAEKTTEREPDFEHAERLLSDVSDFGAEQDAPGAGGSKSEPETVADPLEVAAAMVRRVFWGLSQLLRLKHRDLEFEPGTEKEAGQRLAPLLVKYGLFTGSGGVSKYGEEMDAVGFLGGVTGQTWLKARALKARDAEPEKPEGGGDVSKSETEAVPDDDEPGWLR